MSIPLMPKGVEHSGILYHMSRQERVSIPLMPKGVEHFDTLGDLGRAYIELSPAGPTAFLRYGSNAEECIIRAVGFGGDTDTIGAMAGTLVGALHGGSWIAARGYDNIENGRHGWDEIISLARQLATVALA